MCQNHVIFVSLVCLKLHRQNVYDTILLQTILNNIGDSIMTKVLIVDDNKQILSILSEYTKKEGYTPVIAINGEDAIKKFADESPDVILLDVMMPKMDGFQVCRKIRAVSNVPIIILTVRGEDFEKIMGLDIGADDYIVKPFSPSEIMARIRAVLRRITPSSINGHDLMIFQFSNLTICLEKYEVTVNGIKIDLTKKEIEILWTLATNKQKVYSRENLLNSLWGFDYLGDSRTVDSHIKRLRSKLNILPHPVWEIKTIWGVGYKFEVIDDALS